MKRVCDDARIKSRSKNSLATLFIEKSNHGQHCKRHPSFKDKKRTRAVGGLESCGHFSTRTASA